MLKIKCISESGKLLSNVNEKCDILDIPLYLVTMDIEKVFDSSDLDFLSNLVLVNISDTG